MSVTEQEVIDVQTKVRQRGFEIMDDVFEKGTFCKDCEWCEATQDPYGTGDSPTQYECTAHNPDDCVGVWAYYG